MKLLEGHGKLLVAAGAVVVLVVVVLVVLFRQASPAAQTPGVSPENNTALVDKPAAISPPVVNDTPPASGLTPGDQEWAAGKHQDLQLPDYVDEFKNTPLEAESVTVDVETSDVAGDTGASCWDSCVNSCDPYYSEECSLQCLYDCDGEGSTEERLACRSSCYTECNGGHPEDGACQVSCNHECFGYGSSSGDEDLDGVPEE